MNYRNKRPHFKHKNLLQTIDQTLLDKAFIKKVDFFGILKKDLQTCQNEWGIKCQKECTITCKCLAKFIDMYIQKWFKTNEKVKDLKSAKYQISEEQIKTRLMRALTLKIAPDDEKLMELQCKKLNMLNTEELAETYVNRLTKLLHQQIEFQQQRNESIQFEQYSNTASQVCPSQASHRSQRKHNTNGLQLQNQDFSSNQNPFAKVQDQQAQTTGRRRAPQKKISENLLLKQSEVTTNDPETQHHSKQATPVSGRRILNGGTIISKGSFTDVNKSGDISPLNNQLCKNGLNLGAFSSLGQRKLSFQNLVRNRTPVRKNDLKLNQFEQVLQRKREQKQFTIKDQVKEKNEEYDGSMSSIPLVHQQSNMSQKLEPEVDGEFTQLIRAMDKLANCDSYLESDKFQSSQFATGEREKEDLEDQEKLQEFELMIDSVFLEKNFSTPIKLLPLETDGNMNNFGDYVAQEVANKLTRT